LQKLADHLWLTGTASTDELNLKFRSHLDPIYHCIRVTDFRQSENRTILQSFIPFANRKQKAILNAQASGAPTCAQVSPISSSQPHSFSPPPPTAKPCPCPRQTRPPHKPSPPNGPPPTELVNLPNFRFGTGETLPQLKLHYLTLGTPHRNAAGHVDNAVLLLHGTGGNAHSLINPIFSNVLFGPGQPLDITKYFLILPDDIGHGESSKPSDGLHAHFPAYDYDDMVRSQRVMLDEMKIDHLRLILGTSMGCMQSFVWGEAYPGFHGRARALRLPARPACRPQPHDALYGHPGHQAGPRLDGRRIQDRAGQGLRTANEMLLVMGSSPLQMQKQAPTREQAERYVDQLPGPHHGRHRRQQHDLLHRRQPQLRPQPAPRPDQDPGALDQLRRRLHQPAELGIAEQQVKRMPNARFILLPISDATRGHGTHTAAAVWKDYLVEFMQATEPKP
jgi:homoserine O-acetyltransferase